MLHIDSMLHIKLQTRLHFSLAVPIQLNMFSLFFFDVKLPHYFDIDLSITLFLKIRSCYFGGVVLLYEILMTTEIFFLMFCIESIIVSVCVADLWLHMFLYFGVAVHLDELLIS